MTAFKTGKVFVWIAMGSIFLFSTCRNSREFTYDELNPPAPLAVDSLLDIYLSKYDHFLLDYPQKNTFPRCFDKGEVKWVDGDDWTSGFLPGILWQLYDFSGGQEYLDAAERWTGLLEEQVQNPLTHDVGLTANCSYGQAFRITGDSIYFMALERAAETLAARYDNRVGSIKSLDSFYDYQFPVLIDNLVNNEVLLKVWNIKGNKAYYEIANTHALNTMENHYRKDFSCAQIVEYDQMTGKVASRTNIQGYNDSTAWARGQSWGLYGFCMTFRETGDRVYLDMATRIADYMLDKLYAKKDLIPYWDFMLPGKGNNQYDASAAVIMLSALLDLSTYPEVSNREKYRQASEQVLAAIIRGDYVSSVDQNEFFVLKHCTGSVPGNMEVDASLIYADYYFLESLLKYRSIYLSKN